MQRWRNRIQHGLRWVAILIAVAWTLFPFAYACVLSLKPSALEYRSLYVPFVQFRPTLVHWRWEWRQRHEINGLADGLRNSVVVGLTTAVMSTSVGLLTAFGLRQLRTTARWAGGFIALTLLPRIVPAYPGVPALRPDPSARYIAGTHASPRKPCVAACGGRA